MLQEIFVKISTCIGNHSLMLEWSGSGCNNIFIVNWAFKITCFKIFYVPWALCQSLWSVSICAKQPHWVWTKKRSGCVSSESTWAIALTLGVNSDLGVNSGLGHWPWTFILTLNIHSDLGHKFWCWSLTLGINWPWTFILTLTTNLDLGNSVWIVPNWTFAPTLNKWPWTFTMTTPFCFRGLVHMTFGISTHWTYMDEWTWMNEAMGLPWVWEPQWSFWKRVHILDLAVGNSRG